jgi:hypothetical protein
MGGNGVGVGQRANFGRSCGDLECSKPAIWPTIHGGADIANDRCRLRDVTRGRGARPAVTGYKLLSAGYPHGSSLATDRIIVSHQPQSVNKAPRC